MNRIASLCVTRRVIGEPPSYITTFVLIGSVVGVAFALPLRIIWCRIQPLLVIFLVILGACMRRKRLLKSSPTSYARNALSTYDILIKDSGSGAARWDEAIFVYAAWIAYGSLFHEAKHAAADLALFDDTWLSSAFLISTFRAALFTLGTCFSYSQALVDRSPSFWLAFFTYAAILLALPPLNGVPHTLSIHEIIARTCAFLWLFGVNEFMRGVLEHWHFAALVSEDALDANTILRLQDVSRLVEHPFGNELPLLKLSAASSETTLNLPSQVINVTENQRAIPISWSVLRSAWLLTLASVWITYLCAFVCFIFACYNTLRWSRSSSHWIRKRASGGTIKQSAAATAASSAVVIDVKTLEESAKIERNEVQNLKPFAATKNVQRSTAILSSHFNKNTPADPLQAKKVNFTRRLAAQNNGTIVKKQFEEQLRLQKLKRTTSDT